MHITLFVKFRVSNTQYVIQKVASKKDDKARINQALTRHNDSLRYHSEDHAIHLPTVRTDVLSILTVDEGYVMMN